MKRLLHLLGGAAFCVLGFAITYKALDAKLCSIPAVYWSMPVPVVYWGLGLAWAWCTSRWYKRPMGVAFSGILKPWFLAQVAILAVDLKARLAVSNPLNKVYYLYVLLAMFLFFSYFAYKTARVVKNGWVERAPDDDRALIYPLAFLALIVLLAKNGFMRDLAAIGTVFVVSFFLDAWDFLKKACNSIGRALSPRARFLIVVYIIALVARIAFSVILIGQVGDTYPTASCDGTGYDANGMKIAKDFKSITDGSLCFGIFGPYYWIFLGLVYKLFGHSYYIVAFVQSLFAALLAPLVYLIAQRLTSDERISRTAGLLTAFCMSLIYLSVVLEPEALMIPLLYIALVLIERYGEKGTRHLWRSAALGVVFGLMNGIRSIMVLFPVFIALWLLFFVPHMRLRQKFVNLIVLLLISIAVSMPAEYMYSRYQFRDGTWHKRASSLVMSQGVGTYAALNPELDSLGFNPFASVPESVRAFLKHPKQITLLFTKSVAGNVHRFFFLNFVGYFNPYVLVIPSKYNNLFGAYMLFYMYAFMVIGGIRLFFARLARGSAYLLIFLFVYYLASHPLFFKIIIARHRAPLHPFFIILFALGFFYIWDWIKKNSYQAL